MNFAAVNNVIGLKTLFENRMASVTDRTAAGWTPLHIAAASGHTDSCRYLLTHAADVTSMGRAGLTPSHLAAMYGHLDVLKALFEFDADPECRNQHGFNVIFEVLHSPFIEQPSAKMMIVKWILEQDWFVIDVNGQDYQGNSILGWFAQHYTNGVKLLLGHGAAVNTRSSDGITPLHRAAAVGSLESLLFALRNKAMGMSSSY
ncbi:ankyrin repeat-containing domain protein [Xylaria telfairii]|nr:ankyrin repeat-containing domain protein [Xylaria telfairii]